MRAKNPLTPTVTFPKNLPAKKISSLTISTGVPSAVVCLSKKGEIYQVLHTNTKGLVKTEVTPKTSGVLMVSVSGSSLNVFQGRINIGREK